MATGILIANGNTSVTYTYTPNVDARVIIACGSPGTVNGYSMTVNGATLYSSSGVTSGIATPPQWEIFVGAGQTLTLVWPGSAAMSAVVSCIEE